MDVTAAAGQAGRGLPCILPGSTPVLLRGRQPDARVASVGINPSIREFLSRAGDELTGAHRRFETLSSLGIDLMTDATDSMLQRMRRRSLDYFEANPYMEWFAPMEALVHAVSGASYFDGSACHLDLVPWATRPLWGGLDAAARAHLLAAGRPLVAEQLTNPALDIIYLNGRTVCEAVGEFIPLTRRTARFREQGPRRSFFRGLHHRAIVVGCSSNLQEERLRSADREDFMAWVIDECTRDIAELRTHRPEHNPSAPGTPDVRSPP